MKPWRRPWWLRLLEILRETFSDAEPAPRLLRNSPARIRRLQKRAAQEAGRNPFIAPTRRPRAIQDRGFQ